MRRTHSDEEVVLVPARMLNEVVYCPRLAVLEWVQGEFAPNRDTEEGRVLHHRVDRKQRSGLRNAKRAWADALKPEQKPETEAEEVADDQPAILRSLHMSDEELGLTAVVDLCELSEDSAIPVEYKKGSPQGDSAWSADRVQLGAQMLLLRAHSLNCDYGLVYYATTKQRLTVELTEELATEVQSARDTLLELLRTNTLPDPLVDDARCPRCSLVGICLPDETRAMRGEACPDEVRRLVPARPETSPLYVQAQGARISKKGEELEVWTPESGTTRVRTRELDSVNLLGAVQMTAQTQQALMRQGIPICYFSHGGWFYGVCDGLGHSNVELRMRQYEVAKDTRQAITVARAFIAGKVRNHRTMLRRLVDEENKKVLADLAWLIRDIEKASSIERLLGLEGNAARIWFDQLPRILHTKADDEFELFFHHRNRRPPRDPVNAMLSYGYGILVREHFIITQRAGFDARCGFLHRPRSGRPALALDLMEEFRPLIVDSIVLTMINRKEMGSGDFLRSGDAVSLNAQGRKKLLAAYEKRMDTLVTHPEFGYSISYRRILDVQARLLGRWLLGEIPEYKAFVTR